MIHLATFQSLMDAPAPDIERQLATGLRQRLERSGFKVIPVEAADLETQLRAASSNGAAFLITGYYRRSAVTGNVILYAQILHPQQGYVIDALHADDAVDVLADVGISGAELRVADETRIDLFSRRLAGALLSNPHRRERQENIYESLIGTEIGETRSFPYSAGGSDSTGEIFDLLADEKAVSVASFLETDPSRQPASVTVISREQIELSAARTLNEVLMIYVPGYFLVEDQDDVIGGFRGFAPDSNSKILMLMNGHNINTEWFWGPPDSIMQGIDLDYIERIEVIRGPGSVTLGQGALLGVINIVTRKDLGDDLAYISAAGGSDTYSHVGIHAGRRGAEIEDLRTYFYLGGTTYNGQPLRSQGWAREKDYEGSTASFDLFRGLNEEIDRADSPGDNQLHLLNSPNYATDQCT